MNIRKFIALLLVFAMAAVSLAGCGTAKKDDTEINVGVLKGPTGIGAIKIMDDSENGVYPNYHFTLTPEPTDIVARLSNGDLDIAGNN